MVRPVVALALLALPSVASAQVIVPVGPPMVGGRVVTAPPITNGASALFPVDTPQIPRFSVGGGSLTGAPQILVPSGGWGGVSYAWPVVPVVIVQPVPVPARVPVRRADGTGLLQKPVTTTAEAHATLVMQFPEAAAVTVNGKKAEGDARAEWTLTSPVLAAGASHTFVVKGNWKANGKAFEATRTVTVPTGDRARSIVVTGTEIRE